MKSELTPSTINSPTLSQLAESWRVRASRVQVKFTPDGGRVPEQVLAVVCAFEQCAEELEAFLKTRMKDEG